MEEADRLVPALPGAKTKNLFLRDDKGRRHFLVVLPATKSADLKALASRLGVRKLGFASAERLRKHLGLEPGAVSILGLVNDASGAVEVVLDRKIGKARALLCHPLVNTSTLVVPAEGVRRFLEATGHEARVLEIPGKE